MEDLLSDAPEENVDILDHVEDSPDTPDDPKKASVMASLAVANAIPNGDSIPFVEIAEEITVTGDKGIRAQLGQQWFRDRETELLNAASRLVKDKQATVEQMAAVLNQRFDNPAVYLPEYDAIEKNAAEMLTNTAAITNPAVMKQLFSEEEAANIMNKNVLDEELSTNFVLQRMRDKIASQVEGQGYGETAIDLAALITIPTYDSIVQGQVLETGYFKNLIKGSALKKKLEELMALPYEQRMTKLAEYEKAMEKSGIMGQNAVAMLDVAEEMLNSSDYSTTERDLWAVIDIASIVGYPVVRGAKLLKRVLGLRGFSKTSRGSPISLARNTGNQDMAVNIATQVSDFVRSGKAGDELVEDYIDNVMPAALSVDAPLGMNISNTVQKALIENQRNLDLALDSFPVRRLDDVESAKASLRAQKQLIDTLPDKDIDVISFDVEQDSLSQVMTVKAFIGNGQAGTKPFSSTEDALAGAERYGLVPNSFEVKEVGGGYYIQVSRTVDESGIVKGTKSNLTGPSRWNKIPGLRMVGGSKLLLDFDAAAGAELSVRHQQKFEEVLKPVVARTNRVRDKEGLMTVLEKSREERKWFSDAEIKDYYRNILGKEASDTDLIGYHSVRQIEDFAYTLRNARVRSDLARAGYQEISIKDIDVSFNGKTLEGFPPKVESSSFLDVSRGRVYNIGEMSTEQLRRLKEDMGEDFVLVKSAGPLRVSEYDEGVNYIITTKDKVAQTALRGEQLPYVAGGRVVYRGRHMIKQQTVRTGENGKTYILNPRTHFAMESISDANKVAQEYNDALDAWRTASLAGNPEEIAKASEVISKNTYFSDFYEFDDAIKNGTLRDTPFEVTADRARPRFGLDRTDVEDGFEDYDISDEVIQLIDNGHMFYSKRTDRLRDPRDGFAAILDPFEAAGRSIDEAVRTGAFNNYMIRQADRFIDRYGRFLEGPPGRSNVARMFQDEVRKDAGLSLIEKEQLESVRQTIKRLIGTPDTLQKTAIALKRDLIDQIDLLGGRKVASWAERNNFGVSDTLRSINFNLMLGMFDFSQAMVQVSMVPFMVATDPKNGVRAIGAYGWLRAAMIAGPKTRKTLSQLQRATTGLSPQQFDDLLYDFEKSGAHLVGGTAAQLDDFSSLTPTRGMITSATQKGLEWSRVFFNEGERANRMVAFTTAWLQNGGKRIASYEEAQKVALKSETLAGNMTRASNAAWQKGVFSIPTQFAAHPFRVAELMFTKQAGGFTAKEKAFFVGSAALAYGAQSVPLSEYVYNKYIEATGTLPTARQHATMVSGLMGYMLPETDFSRITPFGQDSIVQQILDPETTLSEIAFGPSGDMVPNIMKGLGGVVTVAKILKGDTRFATEDLGLISDDLVMATSDTIKELSLNISSLRRSSQAYEAYVTGKYISRNGNLLAQDITQFEAGLIALGLPPARSTAAFEAYHDMKVRDEALEDAAKIVTKKFRMMANENTSEEDVKTISRSISLYLSRYGDDEQGLRDKKDIYRKVMRNMGNMTSMTENAFKKHYEAFGLQKSLTKFRYQEEETE